MLTVVHIQMQDHPSWIDYVQAVSAAVDQKRVINLDPPSPAEPGHPTDGSPCPHCSTREELR